MSLEEVRHRVEAAALRVGRDPAQVRIVAVTKGRSPEDLLHLHRQGVADWGENRAQELVARLQGGPPGVRWHFVGHLQTNKVRLVRPVVVLFHSLDRLELGAAWMKGPGLPPPALLQVNISREPEKHGVEPERALEVAGDLLAIGVPLRGLMGMASMASHPEEVRPQFRLLAGLGRDLAARFPAATELSMGMSDDFEVAVEEGATLIRVGRAIFGAR